MWEGKPKGVYYRTFDRDDLVLGERGLLMVPSVPDRVVHVPSPGTFPYEPLCGAAETPDMHYVLDINQVYTHRRICSECAKHSDIPMMLLGDS